MSHLSAGQKRRQKALRRKKRHPVVRRPTPSKNEDSFLLDIGTVSGNSCKLSAIIWDFARPILEYGSWSEDEVHSIVTLVIVSWNLGCLPAGERQDVRHEMLKIIHEDFSDAADEIMEMMDLMVHVRRREFADDRRFVEDFSLTHSPARDYYHLQVVSSQMPPEEFFSLFALKHRVRFSKTTSDQIDDLRQ